MSVETTARGLRSRAGAWAREPWGRLATRGAAGTVAFALLLLGVVAWALGADFLAFWALVWAAVALALVLPFPYAVVSPLFMGVAGWLVNMLPFLILVGWAAVVARWCWGLWVERRLPRGGRWIWVPIGLVAWSALGVVVVPFEDIKHFMLLLGMQALVSGGVLAIGDRITSPEDRGRLIMGLVSFVVLLSVAVLAQWTGINVHGLQDDSISARLEGAYGVDAFENDTGMIKYTPAKEAGALELRNTLKRLAQDDPGLPPFVVFRPRFKAFENHLVVRFEGSARASESDLAARGVDLIFDNVGLKPMHTVPRLRSFPRNALTYAGICAATFPLALALWWTQAARRRVLGVIGVASCLFGAAFSIARGAWAAIAVGLLYLLFDGVVARRLKAYAVLVFLAAALFMTSFFLIRYHTDPLTARALGESSITTREDLYADTIDSISGMNLVLGYGTELPRTGNGGTKAFGEYGAYIPPAGSHSTYLNLLFRTGVVGALLGVVLYAVAWLQARTAARVRSGDEAAMSSLAAMAVVIAAAHGTILSLFVEPAYSLTVTIVLGVALAGSLALPSSILPWKVRRKHPSRDVLSGAEAKR